MPKAKKAQEELPDIPVQDVEISDYVQKWMGVYGREVNTDRAIPDLRDGLKPVQRRVLFIEWEDKLFPTAKFKKSAAIVGNTMKIHPHGDTSIYQSLIVLSQDWKMRVPLINIHGNNGDMSGATAAAMRYTETRLTRGAVSIIDNYKKSVKMLPTYDNSSTEPDYFPSAIPNALINPSSGVGYGLACYNLPHNPIEAIDAAIALVKNPDISNADLLKIIPGPDFPTGGIIVGKAAAKEEMDKGSGTFTVRGTMHREEKGKKEHLLVIDSVPFGSNTTTLIEQIAKIAEETPALNVQSVADETNSDGLRLVVEFKSPDFIDQAEELIWRKTGMEVKLTANATMIVDGQPKQLGVHDLLVKWIEFRKEILTRELNYDLGTTNKKLNIVDGLIKLTDNIEEIIKLVKKAEGRIGFTQDLVDYGFNQEQAENIAGIPLYRLSKQDREGLVKNRQDILDKIGEIKDDLAHIDRFLIENLEQNKKALLTDETLNVKRLTKFVAKVESKQINMNKLKVEAIDSKPAYVAVLSNATAHRMTSRVYANNIEEAKSLKPIVEVVKAKTDDWVLLLTDSGQVVTRLVNDLENVNPKTDVDSFYKQISSLKTSEHFVGGVVFNEKVKQDGGFILSITKLGLAKLSEVEKSMPNTSTKRYLNNLTKYNGLKNDGDLVNVAMYVTPKDVKKKQLVIHLAKGRDIKHDLSDISIQAQGGSGGRKVHPFEKDDVVSVELVDK